MKKQSHLFIFLLLFTGVFFSECKKYPEDDVFIQWRRPEKRLIKYGPWVFDKLTVDGVDKSAEFRADSAYFDELRFSEPTQIGYGTDVKILRRNSFDEEGKHILFDKDKFLKIGILPTYINNSDFHNFGPIFHDDYIEWEILRLSKKGMILKTTYQNSTYVLSLKSSR